MAQKANKILEQLTRHISIFLLFIIAFFFACNSLLFTTFFPADYQEVPMYKKDHPIFLIAVFLFLIFLLPKLQKAFDKLHISAKRLFYVLLAYATLFSVSWIFLSKAAVIGDPRLIYEAVQQLAEGNYFSFETGEYFSRFHHQLGIAAYCELLYWITGSYFPIVFQLINVLWIAVFLYSVFGITRLLFPSEYICRTTLLLLFFCFPLYFYVTFVYGNIPYWGLGTLSLFLFLNYLKNNQLPYFFATLLAISGSILLKSNSMILWIAMLILLILHGFSKKRLSVFFLLLASFIAIPLLTSEGLTKYYSIRTGTAVGSANVPTIARIAMGMQEGYMAEGWYNDYALNTYFEHHFDRTAITEDAKQEIANSLNNFIKNPRYAAKFYYRKTVSMWNEPSFECLLISDDSVGERLGIINSLYYGKANRLILNVMNLFHFIIMAGSFLFLLLYRKKITTEQLLLGIIVIGGVLFHLIWEAKSQYALPYFFLLIPYAAVGLTHKTEEHL